MPARSSAIQCRSSERPSGTRSAACHSGGVPSRPPGPMAARSTSCSTRASSSTPRARSAGSGSAAGQVRDGEPGRERQRASAGDRPTAAAGCRPAPRSRRPPHRRCPRGGPSRSSAAHRVAQRPGGGAPVARHHRGQRAGIVFRLIPAVRLQDRSESYESAQRALSQRCVELILGLRSGCERLRR